MTKRNVARARQAVLGDRNNFVGDREEVGTNRVKLRRSTLTFERYPFDCEPPGFSSRPVIGGFSCVQRAELPVYADDGGAGLHPVGAADFQSARDDASPPWIQGKLTVLNRGSYRRA
jgi:hypothetical protein